MNKDCIDEEQVNVIRSKQEFGPNYYQKLGSDAEYEKCCNLLVKDGIQAIKYNYSNIGKKSVIVRLTQDRKRLSYETVRDPNQKGGLLCCRLGPTKRYIKLSSIHGILFGGQSKTFLKHRDIHFENQKEDDERKESVESQNLRAEQSNALEFNAWQCVSFIRENANTIDFVVKE